jgi:hypothetical protein
VDFRRDEYGFDRKAILGSTLLPEEPERKNSTLDFTRDWKKFEGMLRNKKSSLIMWEDGDGLIEIRGGDTSPES